MKLFSLFFFVSGKFFQVYLFFQLRMDKLIIFDLDGTLLDTITDLAYSVNVALKKKGYPVHEKHEYKNLVGKGITNLLTVALPPGCSDKKTVNEIRSIFIPCYNENCTKRTIPYSGVTELLDSIIKKKWKIAVASNKYQKATEKIVSHYFPDISFSAILGQREGIPVKPDPTIVKELLELTGSKRENTIFIGDSEIDIITARNAAVTSIAVTWGFRSRKLLASFKPDFLSDTTHDLLTILDNI